MVQSQLGTKKCSRLLPGSPHNVMFKYVSGFRWYSNCRRYIKIGYSGNLCLPLGRTVWTYLDKGASFTEFPVSRPSSRVAQWWKIEQKGVTFCTLRSELKLFLEDIYCKTFNDFYLNPTLIQWIHKIPSQHSQHLVCLQPTPRRAPDGLLIWSSGDEAAWIRKYQQWHKWPPPDISHGSCHGKRPKGQKIASSIGKFRELHSPARCSQGRVEANLSVIRIGQQATMPTLQTCHPHGRKDDNHMLSSCWEMTSLVLWTPDSWPQDATVGPLDTECI